MNYLSLGLFLLFLACYLLPFIFLDRRGGFDLLPQEFVYNLALPLLLIGAISEIIALYHVGGLPIFQPTLRHRLPVVITTLAFLIVPGFNIEFKRLLDEDRSSLAFSLFVLSLLLVTVLGYRTEIFALVLSAIIIFYYSREGSGLSRKLKFILPLTLLAYLGHRIVTSFREFGGGGILTRFATTLQIFSSMVKDIGLSLFGYSRGILTLSIFSSIGLLSGPFFNPRGLITTVIGARPEVTTTFTILGIPYIDFGLIGVVLFGLFLGAIFKIGYERVKSEDDGILPIYALCLSFLLISIETGIADFIVVVYFLFYTLLLVI